MRFPTSSPLFMPRPSVLISWIASLFLLLLSFGSLVSGEWLGSLLLFGIALMFLPPLTKRLNAYLHRFARYGIAAVLAVAMLVVMQSAAKPVTRAQDGEAALSSLSASSVAKNDPESPADVLSSIKDISIEIFDEQGRMGAKAQAPIEIIVQANVGDCFDAKAKMYDVMKEVYTDPSLKPSLGRVVFNAPPFLRAAVDAKDGYALSTDSWNGSGPTNFYGVLQRVHDGDGGDVWQTWVQTLSGCY